MTRRVVATCLVLLALVVVASCTGGEAVRTSGTTPTSGPTPEATDPAAEVISSLSWEMFVAPEDFGGSYEPSERPDYLGPAVWWNTTGDQRIVYAITAMGSGCTPAEWSAIEPVEWAYRWYDAPDGGLAWQDLLLMESTEDAAALVESARLTIGASMNDPACGRMNLIAPNENAEPDDFEPTYPVLAVDADCGAGDDCHGVVTELNPCRETGAGQRCTPVTQVIAQAGPVLISIVHSAPEGADASVPIEDLIPAARRAAELVHDG